MQDYNFFLISPDSLEENGSLHQQFCIDSTLYIYNLLDPFPLLNDSALGTSLSTVNTCYDRSIVVSCSLFYILIKNGFVRRELYGQTSQIKKTAKAKS